MNTITFKEISLKAKFLLLVFLVLVGTTDAFSAKPKKNILVLGLDTSQYYSNVFFKSELAYFNDTTAKDVVEYYSKMIMAVMAMHQNKEFEFIMADSSEAANVHLESDFVDTQAFDGESFIAIAAKNQKSQTIQNLLKKYNASYLVSLNAYEINRDKPPQEVAYYINADHIIHYDIFDTALNAVYAGKYVMNSSAAEAYYMALKYDKFAEEVVLRIQAFELDDFEGTYKERFVEAKQRRIKKSGGLGISVGTGAPYGMIGLEWTKYISNNVDLNIGLGYDFSGFKTGAGIRYYLENTSLRFKPFLGVSYSWASGNTFKMGGSKDEMGNQLDPDDVVTFKINSDHALHLRTGFRFIVGKRALLVAGGYSWPFTGNKVELLSERENVDPKKLAERQRFANFMNVGGLDVSITYILYLP